MKLKNRFTGILLPVKSQNIYKYIFIVIYLCTTGAVHSAYPPDTLKALSIGDKVPDMTINNLINYPKTTAKISDFKGKLLILDFWATWCSSCISHFPQMHSLQQQNADKLQILLVNSRASRDTKTAIEQFFEKHGESSTIPTVFDDIRLSKLFPHNAIPHTVWIKDNKVIAIAGADEVNEKNIIDMLNNEMGSLHVKKDIPYSTAKLLFTQGNGGESSYLYRSLLTNYSDGLRSASGTGYTKERKVYRIYNVNATIERLFLQAYPEYRSLSKRRINFTIPNAPGWDKPENSYLWKSRHLFTYELDLPPCLPGEAQYKMQEDLKRYFNLQISQEQRPTDCLVIRQIANSSRHTMPVIASRTNFYDNAEKTKSFESYPINEVIKLLNTDSAVPLINESGYTGNINLSIARDMPDANSLQRSLKSQGIMATIEKRNINYLSISAEYPKASQSSTQP